MTKALAELCHELVQMTFGELSAQIFSTLSEHGRLTISQIYHQSTFPLRQVRQGLGVLIEQQLVTRFIVDDESPAYYSANLNAAYQLSRHDNIVSIVNDRFGRDAGRIVGKILRIGHARIGELANAEVSSSSALWEGDVPINGTETDHEIKLSRFHTITHELLQARVLVKVSARSYLASTDYQTEMEDTIINTIDDFKGGKIHGPKKKKQFAAALGDLKRRWQEEDEYSESRDLVAQGTLHRPHKRPKLNGFTNGHHAVEGQGEDVRLSPDLVVRVNHSKCVQAMRDQRLEQLARRSLGSVAASVYRVLLTLIGKKSPNIQEDEDLANEDTDGGGDMLRQPSVGIGQIAERLEPLPVVVQGLDAPKNEGQSAEINRILKPEGSSDDEDEGPSKGVSTYRAQAGHIANVENYLSILAEHPKRFCQRSTAHGGHNEWQVDLAPITRILMETDLDEVILSRYGKIHSRIVRVLREKGKLEEKQIGAKGMLPVKNIYTLLTQLQYDGVVECQELPKDNSRQPGRTLYLWYIDDARVRDQLVQRAYKTMTRFLQRVHTERQRYQVIIEKAERSDVQGQEQEKLAANEKETLKRWREVEERLLGQVSRMDETVALYRDFMASDMTMGGK